MSWSIPSLVSINSGRYQGQYQCSEFYKEYIDKICRHDELHNTDFMETLINIVQNGWNLKLASDTMYLHYNTIKYRYKKIEEISGLNLDRTEEKLSMELAVKIYLMNHI